MVRYVPHFSRLFQSFKKFIFMLYFVLIQRKIYILKGKEFIYIKGIFSSPNITHNLIKGLS